ncbi:MAG: FIG00665670: hypothetical protein [uncultured Acidimicrobiales bacterium]|uniref:Uncharacterized protein n=1 Tax=uncultured Acidimicrobiales bacterium TaxID=310071 RepID=A0A6J4J3C9_9ACTN|nr:MAG: FIG00665670: hypothetical protein [uncultured Acidimicrobiales bacterium]
MTREVVATRRRRLLRRGMEHTGRKERQDGGVTGLSKDGDDVVVRLGWLEKVGAFHGDVRFPRSAVRDVRVVERPVSEVSGVRMPGTGLPGVIALGTWRRRGGKDFVAIYRGRPGVVIDLDRAAAGFDRLIVSVDDPDETLLLTT